MKKLLKTSLLLSILASALTATEVSTNVSNFIVFESQKNQSTALASFLTKGAKIIKDTEPNTLLWSALQRKDEFVIFDTFHDEEGQNQHFSGKVAAALKEGSATMVLLH